MELDLDLLPVGEVGDDGSPRLTVCADARFRPLGGDDGVNTLEGLFLSFFCDMWLDHSAKI